MHKHSLAIPLALALGTPALAQVTELTLQGQLRNAGQPASGLHDLQFRLFDGAAGGAQLGPTLCLDNVALTNGVFSARLDFGQQYAASQPRFLEVQTRADTGQDCSTVAGMVVLGPRLRFTGAPSAVHALSAFSLDAPSGTHPDALFLDNSGLLGVGTLVPQATLHVIGSGQALSVQGSSPGNANLAFLSFSDAAGSRTGAVGDVNTGDATVSLGSDFGDVKLFPGGSQAIVIKSSGLVGIGTTVPIAQLEVNGEINLGPLGQLHATAADEPLVIIRGTILANGAIANGTGFTVTQPETGKYDIRFTPAFAGLPAITATVVDIGPTEALPFLEFPTSSGVLLEVYERDTSDFVNRTVMFMAAGPRS